MENFRSMSCRDGRIMQMGSEEDSSKNGAPANMQDLRSYSTSYASNYMQVHPQPHSNNNNKVSKANNGNHHHHMNDGNGKKNRGFGSAATSYANSSSAKGWSLSDPEVQRKKRVASYKVYAVEGKMKGSFRKSFRWVKHTCSQVVHGWW